MALSYRNYVTPSVGFTFMVVGFTGLLFKFSIRNHLLEDIHGWLGVGMVAAALFHIGQHWRSLMNYFRNRKVFALLIPIVAVIAFFVLTQKEETQRLNPREVMRKLSAGNASDVARAFGADPASVLMNMRRDGLQAGSSLNTIEEIARQNQKPPEVILAYFAKVETHEKK